MGKIKVLFLCIHNSARSQTAEAFLNQLAGDTFEAESAGLEPGSLSPLAIETMKEIGIDISLNETKSVFDKHASGTKFDYVITLCDESSAAACPFFPGIRASFHWSFEDPANFTGSLEDTLNKMRYVRNAIRKKVQKFIIEADTHQIFE